MSQCLTIVIERQEYPYIYAALRCRGKFEKILLRQELMLACQPKSGIGHFFDDGVAGDKMLPGKSDVS